MSMVAWAGWVHEAKTLRAGSGIASGVYQTSRFGNASGRQTLAARCQVFPPLSVTEAMGSEHDVPVATTATRRNPEPVVKRNLAPRLVTSALPDELAAWSCRRMGMRPAASAAREAGPIKVPIAVRAATPARSEALRRSLRMALPSEPASFSGPQVVHLARIHVQAVHH